MIHNFIDRDGNVIWKQEVATVTPVPQLDWKVTLNGKIYAIESINAIYSNYNEIKEIVFSVFEYSNSRQI